MSYRSETIALAVGRMNRQYFLPAIQREFVWKPEQIVQLFDSIMRGYPISSFLFWELKPENRDKWQVYEFLEKAHHGGTHNQLASTDGVTSLSLVLDGQQRLTSLMIGLRGTYTAKKKYKRWDNPDARSAQKLHLDLLAPTAARHRRAAFTTSSSLWKRHQHRIPTITGSGSGEFWTSTSVR